MLCEKRITHGPSSWQHRPNRHLVKLILDPEQVHDYTSGTPGNAIPVLRQ